MLESSRELCTEVSKKQRRSPGDSQHDHTKGKLLPVFTPSHSNWAIVWQQGPSGLFCHPLSEAMQRSAREQGVCAAPLPLLLRDGLWMKRGDISCRLLVWFAFPPPRWQGHHIRLDCHMENMHRDAQRAEGNETPTTQCKREQVPD